jgi:hypothetical protein
MPRGKAAKAITLRPRAAGGEPRTVELTAAEFLLLRRIAETQTQVKDCGEKPFARLKARGLVTHKFQQDRGGWPLAYAQLTADGEQALALEFA